MNVVLNAKQKFFLVLLLSFGAFLSLFGGFRVNHIDTEYHKTLYNKSYFLHNIYHVASTLEFEFKKVFEKNNQRTHKLTLKKFKKTNQRHGISLYLVNGVFALLGIFFCFRLCYLFTQHFWLSYLAAGILSTCYFWNAENHYPTTDVPLTALIISTLFFLLQNHFNGKNLNTEDKIYEGLLLGACFAVKYAGIIILAPYLFLKYQNKSLKDSFLSITIAIIFLVISIADKFARLWQNIVVEYKVQTEIGWAGYNSDEAGFLYHIKHSLINEYGLLLSILSLVGFYYAYTRFKDNKDKYLALKVVFVFMLAITIMISSTVIKTVRFALPLIPFLSIFSALGIYQIYLLIKNFNPSLAKILTTLLTLGSIAPALRNSIKHDYLMYKPDTVRFVTDLRNATAKVGAINIILDDIKLFDKSPQLDDLEYLRRCSSEPKDFQKIFNFEKHPNLIVATNSYKLDRFIFDKTYHCDNGHKAFKNYESLKLVQINPFSTNKAQVPFSFISNFSPRKPDLKYRNHKGAFFELFYSNPMYEEVMKKVCKEKNYPCVFTTGEKSYFLRTIQTSFVDPNVRKELAKNKLLEKKKGN